MTLNEAIAAAIAAKRFRSVLIQQTPSGQWQGNVRVAGVSTYAVGLDPDPVEALRKAAEAAAGWKAEPAPLLETAGIFD